MFNDLPQLSGLVRGRGGESDVFKFWIQFQLSDNDKLYSLSQTEERLRISPTLLSSHSAIWRRKNKLLASTRKRKKKKMLRWMAKRSLFLWKHTNERAREMLLRGLTGIVGGDFRAVWIWNWFRNNVLLPRPRGRVVRLDTMRWISHLKYHCSERNKGDFNLQLESDLRNTQHFSFNVANLCVYFDVWVMTREISL